MIRSARSRSRSSSVFGKLANRFAVEEPEGAFGVAGTPSSNRSLARHQDGCPEAELSAEAFSVDQLSGLRPSS
jgi:hypothetical protein